MPPKAAVIVPLYLYPLPGAWTPLHEAIASHPSIDFLIVLNPNSGPGADWMPDASYTAEIPILNAQHNVRTVGYVRLDYCRRAPSQVQEDIAKYASWSRDARSALGVQGIFFDETPNLYSAHVASYLETVNRLVKDSTGFGAPRLVIHNPGTIPDPGLAAPGPDVTAVVEESYANYTSAPVQQRLALLRIPQYGRSKSCYIVHSVPHNKQTELVKDLRRHGAYIFVTDRRKKFYEGFGKMWSDFLDTMEIPPCHVSDPGTFISDA